MKLFSRTDAQPPGKPGHRIWGRTKRNELIDLGEYPRLSLGERLLKTYKEFNQIKLTEQDVTFESDPRSATGEMYFKVHFNATFRVRQERATELLEAEGDPVERFIKAPLRQQAEEIADRFSADDDRGFQEQLRAALNARSVGTSPTGPLELVGVGVRAHVPSGVRARSEIAMMLKDLDARIPLAEVEGNTAEADRLRRARQALNEATEIKGNDSISNAERVRKMQAIIDDLINSGVRRDSDTVRSLETEQLLLMKSVAPTPGLEGPGDSKKKLPDDDDDAEDLN